MNRRILLPQIVCLVSNHLIYWPTSASPFALTRRKVLRFVQASAIATMLTVFVLACSSYAQTPATPATGTVTITIPSSTCGGNAGIKKWIINVNGAKTELFDPNGTGLPGYTGSFSTIAEEMASVLNSGCDHCDYNNAPVKSNPYVTATASGNIVTLTTRSTGSTTNYPFSAEWTFIPVLPQLLNCPTPLEIPLPTSGPTLTGGTDPGVFINPKYVIVGVTYAPPGAQSFVTYTNSVLVGNTTTIKNSFTNQTNVSVQASLKIAAFGTGGKIAGTESTSYSQMSGSSNMVTLNKTTQVSDETRGPSNSFAGLNHDLDVIWLWLNPVLPISLPDINNPQTVTWQGYGYDPNDQPGLDVLPVYVGWLNGDIPVPGNVSTVLARTWASGYSWGPGQGPGLTGPGPGTDFAAILQADPLWQCNMLPPVCPATPDANRFTLIDSQNIQYEQAPVGGQPITQTETLQNQNTSQTGQSTSTTFQEAFGLEEGFSILGDNLTGDLKQSNTLTWTTSTDTATTNTANSSAFASITGPACTPTTSSDVCGPEYSGPVEFEIYQDNQYGTFMFFPAGRLGPSGAHVALPPPAPLVSNQIMVLASGLAYSRVTGTFNGTVTLTNSSSSAITGPLQIVFKSLPAGVTLANATNSIGGWPYITVPVGSLAPGQPTTVNVQFKNPSHGFINFSPITYSGNFN